VSSAEDRLGIPFGLKETRHKERLDSDSALALLMRTSAPRIPDFIRAYVEIGGLYERVRAARVRVRHLVTRRRRVIGMHEPEQYAPALAGLVTTLGLTRNLYPPDMSATALHQKLTDLVYDLPEPTIRDVTTAVVG
jgi:hypothetical protein